MPIHSDNDARSAAERAEELVAKHFVAHGWKVQRSRAAAGAPRPDLVARRGRIAYAIEVKAAPEGRPDRLVALWSQAWLQAVRAAGSGPRPLAIVVAPRVPRRSADAVLMFAADVAPDSAAAVMDYAGLSAFRGERLDELSAESSDARGRVAPRSAPSANLFSDANQWMLKVLCAPELPPGFIGIEPKPIGNSAQLAKAANFSAMSASRFVRQLRAEGFLDDSGAQLRLVRRRELFDQWRSYSAMNAAPDVPIRVLIRGSVDKELSRRLAGPGKPCVGLFAAADLLGVGIVHGVPPHIYVRRLGELLADPRARISVAEPGDRPDFILLESRFPASVQRGAVAIRGRRAADIIQVWLDASAYPARGREQADAIERRVLAKLIGR